MKENKDLQTQIMRIKSQHDEMSPNCRVAQ